MFNPDAPRTECLILGTGKSAGKESDADHRAEAQQITMEQSNNSSMEVP
jgi:hypothetical protein